MTPTQVDPRFVQAMTILFPNAHVGRDYSLSFDGANWSLIDWQLGGTPPTSETVTSALATFDWQAYQATAQAALDASDTVAIRCFKAAVPFPAEWQTYVQALRAIMHAISGDPTQALPAKPAYPAGT